MLNFEEAYFDVLQNIEFAIVSVYRRNPELTDYDVEKVLDALVKFYNAERRQSSYKKPAMSSRAEQVYESVQLMCNWRLGRKRLESKDHDAKMGTPEPITIQEAIDCLKRVQKSVRKWNKRAGTRGYLQFVDQFIP
jgi:hypothetical protein